MNADGVSGRAV